LRKIILLLLLFSLLTYPASAEQPDYSKEFSYGICNVEGNTCDIFYRVHPLYADGNVRNIQIYVDGAFMYMWSGDDIDGYQFKHTTFAPGTHTISAQTRVYTPGLVTIYDETTSMTIIAKKNKLDYPRQVEVPEFPSIALPAVLGRICPEICEKACRRKSSDAAVSICRLKQFAADYDIASEQPYLPEKNPPSGKRVAIIGAGPAGLSAAYYLLRDGHNCTLFDDHAQPGGALRYEVPEDMLPKKRRRSSSPSTMTAVAGMQSQSVVCGASGEPCLIATSIMAAIARTTTSAANPCLRASSEILTR
jgi:hypothetical protein